ncbi:probable dolichyl pyrophosphate Glc1Man9GlcNAc2 alpha-1,3-glucosyltransferase [Penaeus japonicus]|uniref:probable dolichyl pyrophosphate Glc1Man9GlcNAc2 alpha-1,3-glucosyltransferase n=1 Tax=Penaeus japonicus TaxID=27405 RepID=UPI001C715B56|nr:probable dolichyl pyrophosphate Glc1Man9GlcNAc2 alpha-1,3-glucosyltransferase [Penaeus japonicus]XP_042880306.1 probable dolichyl pyrophosphate Glc1Man9GlcNAc2 alpha-1,3-glucosyltransferase [Penaeus japonicus]XP_042880307.1 probable dolichyl pyrophosphate Glc1Man9GlcNAc2 alpha-1,3-glucosyltransferase [Penaeus japonicus]XP_042880308.1 probable dolichyl pyrophosphate Glc1Man9GlcNAc2 alpha-1,3-glucosyltransferase [Penaeus japonicus]XP_042880309.1 probable dolichyl pyrophosphate Glc1Man9GlcNAc2 
MFWAVVVGISCIKLLLIPAYRSTDFEVHRNWLAITHSLPISEWYVEETSEWTLDYPPLFAWFEWVLAKVAQFFDQEMLKVQNLNYASPMTVLFQRLSVIVTDLVYAYGCKLCSDEAGRFSGRRDVIVPLFIILFSNAGLLIVDHIHFQYNGFLYGIMFLSVARILQRREIEAAFWFSVLLNLKHIYLYVAPAYFVYLLRSYCLSSTSDGRIKFKASSLLRLLQLGVTVLSVFGLSFGPFYLTGQIGQVLSRLFPFKRGLSHAYWAPNFWALYNFADKVLEVAGNKLGYVSIAGKASMTGGLVQEFEHAVLPSITPPITFIATLLSILPSLVNLWKTPHNPWQFIRCLVLCGFGSYMFGWHVHEKAILLIILPLGLLCLQKKMEAQIFIIMSVVGHFSLFPLLFTHHETPIKVTALLLHAIFTGYTLLNYWLPGKNTGLIPRIPLCSIAETTYLLGLVNIFLYQQVGHQLLGLQEKMPFLPLMLISVYCGVGVTYCWLKYYRSILSSAKKGKKKSH